LISKSLLKYLEEDVKDSSSPRLRRLLRADAEKEAAKPNSEEWSKILKFLGGNATISSRVFGPCGSCCPAADVTAPTDPESGLLWNANGLKARWDFNSPRLFSDEACVDIIIPGAPREKRSLTFRDVVAATGHRDVLYILESKMHMTALLQMKGFIEWKERSGYNYVFSTWGETSRNKAGYSGVVMLSKVRPLRVSFGLRDMEPGDEGRVLTAVYPSFVHVASYNPCAGYDKGKLAYKLRFESRLKAHLESIKNEYPDKEIVWLADANTNPTDTDYDKNAFNQVRHRRADAEIKAGCSVDHPGCSAEERESC
jgi:exonuclease III